MLCYLQPKNAIINDINNELISTYKCLKNYPSELIKQLDFYKQKHNKEYFYKIRKETNTKQIDVAARFIYLNKTCFNGLYRVNAYGQFNVPFNFKNKDSLNLYNKENILNWNKYLKNNNIKIFNKNYLEILDLAKEGDFVYCDPPYDYEIGVKGFDSYNKSSFGQENQIKLANKLKKLDSINVKWMLSNHNTKLINELYKNFHIRYIDTNRMINSKANSRIRTGKEVIVTNYEI